MFLFSLWGMISILGFRVTGMLNVLARKRDSMLLTSVPEQYKDTYIQKRELGEEG